MKFNKFEIIETIFEGHGTILYRANNKDISHKVILKVAKTPDAAMRLKNEYDILKDLNIEGASKVNGYYPHAEDPFITISDLDGLPLINYIEKFKNYSNERLCGIFINLATIISRIHKENIIHKDIKPSNILYKEENDSVNIIDFGISSQYDFKLREQANLNNLEGTLKYISPEQTGRINRSVDQRSDLYSLGITFYQMLSGDVPFNSDDPMELIHSHISRNPERISFISKTFNEIIFKLLEKNPENRYQSTYGLLYDLEKIRKGEKDFKIATKDYSPRLQVNENLYGREKEKNILKTLFENTSLAVEKANYLVIKGDAGQGKSILIEEILKNTILKKGYFLRGKQDQIQQNIPYFGISQILNKYTNLLLSESANTQKRIKDKLIEALDDNAGIITLLAPEMELILGKQPTPSILEGSEAENRFNVIILNLIKVMANTSSPLVIILDDLQWADTGTINLVKKIINEKYIPGLLFIVSFRNKEEQYSETFLGLIEYLDSTIHVEQLELSNLNKMDIAAFLKDTIGENTNQFHSLVEFIFITTHGNPFFIKELLRELYSNKALIFDFNTERWHFDNRVIQSLSMGENVLDFMKIKIKSFSKEAILVLKIAACEGLVFNKDAVLLISKLPENEFDSAIKEASISSIIYPLLNNSQTESYYFLHDRILQAAYQLNSAEDIREYNFQFGHYYLKHFPDAKIFDICNFYNNSFEKFTKEEDLINLIQINYRAMLLSKANIAYATGLSFGNIIISYLEKVNSLPEDFIFSIYEHYGWLLFATGNFEEGEKIYLKLIDQCKDLKDYSRLNNVRIGSLASRARIFDSVNLGLEVLRKLGVIIPNSEEERGAMFFSEFGKILNYLEKYEVKDLLNLEPMVDEIQILIQQILSRLLIPTILSAQLTLLGVLTCISITLVIEFGSIDLVAYAYALFAGTIISVKQDYKTGIEFGEIAIAASQINNNKALMGGVFNTVGCITNHLKYPAVANESLFQRGSKYCEESGNIFETALNLGNALWNKFYRGENLEEIFIYCNNYRNVCKKYFIWEAMINVYYPTMGIVNYLTDRQTDQDLLHYDGRTELEHVDIVEQLGSKSPLAQFYGILITKSFLFGRYSDILKTGELLEKNTAAPTVFHDICPNFYRCVSYILVLNSLSEEEKNFFNKKIIKLKSDFKIFSELNPNNFLHMYLLIQAVELSKSDSPWEAMQYFDESIASALENGYIQNAAIAYELAGNFYTEQHRYKIADTYYYECYKLYKLWGAKLKIKAMDLRFPHFKNYRIETTQMSIFPTQNTQKSSADFQINYLSTIKATDIILREVKTDSLIEKIIQVILEISGASEASFIIKKKDTFILHTHGSVSDKINSEFINIPVEEFENISHKIVTYVLHMKKTIILSEAYKQSDYLNNNYLVNKKVKSLLCQPILHKGDVIGALYLENNFIAGVFSENRTEVINLISTLAGISIENALLYEDLDEKVKLRTSELHAANTKLIETNSLLEKTLYDLKTTQDQLLISEKMVLLGKLIAGIAHEINTPLGAIIASNQTIMDLISGNFLNMLETYDKFGSKEKDAWNILYNIAKENNEFLDTVVARNIKREITEYLKEHGKKLNEYTIDNLSELGISTQNIDLLLPFIDLENFEIIVENSLNVFTLLYSGRIIKNAADKASRVIRALKNYVHQDLMEKPKLINIRREIEMCLVLHQNKLKSGMEIITDIPEDLTSFGYSDQLSQVWMNLISNALFAVQYKGKLVIRGFIKGDYVCISFTDNGHGIPENIKANIFKPFFTTKSSEDGSGLGLDICKKIVENHKGKLEFTSVPGETCFTVYLNRFFEDTLL